jgi:spermidine dehydrogenase
MTKKVTRCDFLNSMTVGTGAIMLQACGSANEPSLILIPKVPTLFAPQPATSYYSTTLTSMRGSHEGSLEVVHDLAWRAVEEQTA